MFLLRKNSSASCNTIWKLSKVAFQHRPVSFSSCFSFFLIMLSSCDDKMCVRLTAAVALISVLHVSNFCRNCFKRFSKLCNLYIYRLQILCKPQKNIRRKTPKLLHIWKHIQFCALLFQRVWFAKYKLHILYKLSRAYPSPHKLVRIAFHARWTGRMMFAHMSKEENKPPTLNPKRNSCPTCRKTKA